MVNKNLSPYPKTAHPDKYKQAKSKRLGGKQKKGPLYPQNKEAKRIKKMGGGMMISKPKKKK